MALNNLNIVIFISGLIIGFLTKNLLPQFFNSFIDHYIYFKLLKQGSITIDILEYKINYYKITEKDRGPLPPNQVRKTDNPNTVKVKMTLIFTNNSENVYNLRNMHIIIKDKRKKIIPKEDCFTVENNLYRINYFTLYPHDTTKLVCHPVFNVVDLVPIIKKKVVIFSYTIGKKEKNNKILVLTNENNETL